jgi:hypothetical protein
LNQRAGQRAWAAVGNKIIPLGGHIFLSTANGDASLFRRKQHMSKVFTWGLGANEKEEFWRSHEAWRILEDQQQQHSLVKVPKAAGRRYILNNAKYWKNNGHDLMEQGTVGG